MALFSFTSGGASAMALRVAGVLAASWTGPTGSVTIATTTQATVVAPAPVWFEVTSLTGLTGAEGPSGGAYHDPSFHEITYLWTVRGSPLAPYSAPQNMVPGWNNPNVQWGKKVAFSFPDPGTYIVDLLAIDANGNTAVADSGTITVLDPDAVFPGAQTIAVALDGDHTGAPTGASTVNTIAAAQALMDTATTLTRVVLKRGEVYENAVFTINSSNRMAYLGAWGTGAKPLVRAVYKEVGVVKVLQNHNEPQFTITDIDAESDWDCTTELGSPVDAVVSLTQAGISNVVYMWHNIKAEGFGTPFNINFFYVPSVYSGQRALLSNCETNNWSSYGIFVQNSARDHHVAVLGCKITLDPDALNGGGNKNMLYNLHGPIRVSECDDYYMSGCDIYSRSGWSNGGNSTYADQPCIRLDAQGVLDNYSLVNRCVMEGGFMVIDMDGQDDAYPDSPCNHLVENNLLITTEAFFGSVVENSKAALTFRNNVAVIPNVGTRSSGNSTQRALISHVVDNAAAGIYDEPIFIYNNTLLNLQNSANDRDRTWVISHDRGTTPETQFPVTEVNNLLHFPDGDNPVTSAAPVSLSTSFTNITLRHKGVRYGFDYYDGSIPSGTLANGASMVIPYGDLRDGLVTARVGASSGNPTTQAYWQAVPVTDNRHMIRLGNGTYYDAHYGGFTVHYDDPAGVTITNTSGVAWVNASYRIKLDRSSLIPAMDTTNASPATIPMPVPQAGSAAYLTATSGLVANRDFYGSTAATPRSRGAV